MLHGVEDAAGKALALLDAFGSLPRAVQGSPRRQLRAVSGDRIAVAALSAFREAMLAHLTPRPEARPLLSNWSQLLDYLQARLAHERVEQVRLLHLNARNRLILDEEIARGTIDRAELHAREVTSRALELGSSALILVHNHPSGDPTPTRADIDITRAIIEATRPLGIEVHDHLVIGTAGHSSLRALGLI